MKLYCADFESEVPSLLLPERWGHRRLFVTYGNTFGNVADERHFCEQLHDMTQPGDLLWVEVAAARDSLHDELHMATAQQRNSSLSQAGAWRDLDERAKLFTVPLYVTGQGDHLELTVEAMAHPDARCAVEGSCDRDLEVSLTGAVVRDPLSTPLPSGAPGDVVRGLWVSALLASG